jgi:hypothetical protein
MARAPETGFYFEPISERLALVLEGAPFPSDDAWAHVGDPVEMSPEAARLSVATRWPGVDPETLEIEFDTDFERMAAEMERVAQEEGRAPAPGEEEIDVRFLLQQAESLRAMAAELQLPGARELEAELERPADTVGEDIARAHLTSGRKDS